MMSLMSFLSFQDVVRQRAEKVQAMIDAVEGKIRDLLAKFNLKIAEPEEDEEVAAAQEAASDPFQEVVDQTSIDDLFD